MLEIGLNLDTRPMGTVVFDGGRARKMTRVLPQTVSLTQRFGPERERIERFIDSVYAKSYGALIGQHYPRFISVHGRDGSIIATAGLRCAGDGPLYLERYLPSPVEQLLRSGDRSPVARSEIVEIGNLASSGRGGSLFLFVMLTAFLHRSRITHAAVTATQSLRRTFAAFGFEFSQLARACPQRLPDGGSSWGSYFRTDPWVLAGPIAPASARLGAYLPDEHNGDLEDLTARLHSCEQDPLS